MNIFVTGASGWLGSELVKNLLEKGYHVKALLRNSNRKNIIDIKKKYPNTFEIIKGDILESDLLDKSLKNIDILYHLAAKVHCLSKNKKDDNEFFEINAKASEELFNLAIKNRVKRVIFYSSVSVYGESDKSITISTNKKPITSYAKSKLYAENIALNLFENKGLPITIIEPVTVYGGNDMGNFGKLKSLIDKGFIAIFGDGNNKKTIIYYKDLIKMTINIANDKEAIGKVIIGGTEVITLNKIINIFKKASNRKVITFKFNNFSTDLFIKTLNLFGFSFTKKLARQILVLSSNNEYDLSNCKNYLKEYTSFEDYNNLNKW